MTLASNESAFVCIQPGSENYITTGDAEAIQIGCCCECESYRITGNTPYGTTIYGGIYCGTNNSTGMVIPPGVDVTICVDARYLFVALVNGTGPGGTLILPDVESLGCCTT